jgi:putative DNA primase/helicase
MVDPFLDALRKEDLENNLLKEAEELASTWAALPLPERTRRRGNILHRCSRLDPNGIAAVRDCFAGARVMTKGEFDQSVRKDNSASPRKAEKKPALGKDIPLGLLDYALSDAGNAERFIHSNGLILRYCRPWGAWLIWDEKRWERDAKGTILALALGTLREFQREAVHAEVDPDYRSRCLKWGLASESASRLHSMVAIAGSLPEVALLPSDFDADPWLLNVENGILDLRNGTLRKQKPGDRITKMAPVSYDSEATAPIWERFLQRIFDGRQDLVAFMQRAVGYSLTGQTSEQVLFFLYGGGSNGKSTLLDVLLTLMGDYGQQAAPGLLVEKRNESHPTEVADLAGARLVVSTEVKPGRHLAEDLVKSLTGGDRVKARFMREDFFPSFPYASSFFARIIAPG